MVEGKTGEENQQNVQKITLQGVDGAKIIFVAKGNLGFRELGKPQLGRRYVCAQEVTITKPNPKLGEPDLILLEPRTGEIDTPEGKINLGCGAQVLCTKASKEGEERSGPICCQMPMAPQIPKPLPSSD